MIDSQRLMEADNQTDRKLLNELTIINFVSTSFLIGCNPWAIFKWFCRKKSFKESHLPLKIVHTLSKTMLARGLK